MNRKTISINVNGVERSVEVEARTTLLDLVREQFELTGAKLGLHVARQRQTGKRVFCSGCRRRRLRGRDHRRIGQQWQARSGPRSVHGVWRFTVRLLYVGVHLDCESLAGGMP
jgi:hypothetical protein